MKLSATNDPMRVVLASILTRPAIFDLVRARIQLDDVQEVQERTAWRAMLALADRGIDISQPALWNWVNENDLVGNLAAGGSRTDALAYLAYLADEIPDASLRIDPFIDSVVNRARLRQAGIKATEIAAAAKNHAGDVQAFVDRAVEAFRDIADRRSVNGSVHVKDALEEKFKAWRLADEGKTSRGGLTTGLSSLDTILGGLRPQKLYCLAARPGVGKSALALNIATHVGCRGGGVLFFSLEMGRDELTTRQLAALSGVSSESIEHPERLRDFEYDRITKAASVLSKYPIWINDGSPPPEKEGDEARPAPENTVGSALGIVELRAEIKRVDSDIKRKGGTGLALVVVDYIGLMKEPEGSRNREQAIGKISQGLKAITMQRKIPIIEISQMNRSVETRGGKPRLSDLRESGSLEQDADVVIFLHRDTKQNGDDVADGPTDCIIAKQRGGRKGIVKLCFHGAQTRFTEENETPERCADEWQNGHEDDL